MSDSEMAEHIAKVRQEVSEWPEWKKKLLADSLNPYRESEKSMSDDKMRQEFEKWAAREEYNLVRYSWPDEKHSKGYGSEYADNKTTAAEHGFEAGYQAGLKAEREAMAKDYEEFTKQVLNGEPWPDADWE